ncbi:hypothetical protein VKT23_000020 [Stygiomarasmius scandens]|uniref:Cytochrome P450 n=1 Tax=Marasmiellus scandens TaxID=2682957 RepID=A0ABR1K8F5_9AGAR
MFIISGHEIVKDNDTFIEIASNVSNCMNNAGPSGSTPVDFFPCLQYFPSWFPGTFYANHARDSYNTIRQVHDIPVEYAREQLNKGTAQTSFVSHLLDEIDVEIESVDSAEERQNLYDQGLWHVRGAAATAYAAGGDTTYTTLRVFFLVMTLYPQIQKKAQDEIDHVLGTEIQGINRLPEIEDRENLPFVECVFQETLRWFPVLSIGVPHRSLEDDIYKGMFIPKGSIIFANARGMSLDERIYSEPRVFSPMRFMPIEKGGKGEPYFVGGWGFGRRICPGRHLADTEVWLAMATTLATLDISQAKGEDGKEIPPELKFSDGIVK